jgi:hypothetical protein
MGDDRINEDAADLSPESRAHAGLSRRIVGILLMLVPLVILAALAYGLMRIFFPFADVR